MKEVRIAILKNAFYPYGTITATSKSTGTVYTFHNCIIAQSENKQSAQIYMLGQDEQPIAQFPYESFIYTYEFKYKK